MMPRVAQKGPLLGQSGAEADPAGGILSDLSGRVAALGATPMRRALLLLGIVLFAALVRLDVLRVWLAEPELYFHQGLPLERSVDGYRSMAQARDLLAGTYEGADERRRVPDPPLRPQPPLLIAVAAATLHRFTGLPLEVIAAVLPVLLGPLVAVPLYLLGRRLGGTPMGLTAALFGALSPFYVARSSFGWFDTDILNVTLVLATAYTALRFGAARTQLRWGWLAGHLVLTGLFIWWWWPARGVALGLSLAPLAVALALHYRPARREALVALPLLAALVAAAFVLAGTDPTGLWQSAQGLWRYISKASIPELPSIGLVNMEQLRLPPELLARWSMGSWAGFLLGLAGVLWLLLAHPRRCAYLAALLFLALLGLFIAARFLIFTGALLALGIGFLASGLWRRRRRSPALGALVPAGIVVLLGPTVAVVVGEPAPLHQPAPLVAMLTKASRELPEDAVIWAAWGHGNAIHYWSDRGTIADGDYHGPRITLYRAYPLTLDYDRTAANFMRLVVGRGVRGLEQWVRAHGGDRALAFARLEQFLAGGPELAARALAQHPPQAVGPWRTASDWLDFLFPAQARPVYLLLDPVVTGSLPGWWPMGTWDYRADSGEQTRFAHFSDVRVVDTDPATGLPRRLATADGVLELDPETGVLQALGVVVPLSHLLMQTTGAPLVHRWPRQSGYRLEVHAERGTAALMDARVAASLFNRLYLRALPSKYFVPVLMDPPRYGLWRVDADSPP